jgi:ABC-type nitrate/sulfonate/bicarbonate transport system permease component
MNDKKTVMNQKTKGLSLSVGTLTVLFILWWLLTDTLGMVKSLYFPSPKEVWETIKMMNEQILYHALATSARVLVSWIIGSVSGVLIGLLMARDKVIYNILNPIVEMLRPVPPVALIPLVLVWFGIGDFGKIFIIALACFMVMAVNTIVACGNVPLVYLQASETMGASKKTTYKKVFLPAIIPEIMSGARIGIALAFAITVATEFMGAKYGVGYLIMQASRTLNTAVVVLGTIIIGIEAFILERLLHMVSKRVTRWKESAS